MMKKRRPTRRDLLVVVGRLQDLVGEARAAFHDRNPNRQEETDSALYRALMLCIDARSHEIGRAHV